METINLAEVAKFFCLSEEELLKEAIELFFQQKKQQISLDLIEANKETTKLAKVAEIFNLSEAELLEEAIGLFLQGKRDRGLQIQREIFAQYGATSLEDLESRINEGIFDEHPAWEDLIFAENLTDDLEEIDSCLAHLNPLTSSYHSLAV